MNPRHHAINVALNKWDGWLVVDVPFIPNKTPPAELRRFTPEAARHFRKVYPSAICKLIDNFFDPLTGLSHCHRIEGKLTDEQLWEVVKLIVKWQGGVAGFPVLGMQEAIALLKADASQHAEALAMALGLEVENPETAADQQPTQI